VAAYQPALALIELLSEGQGILLDSADGTVQLPGFLFDMNHFFQALIARFLTEYLPDYEVQEEYRLAKLFAYDPAHNPNHRRAPTPRPDFAVSHGHTTTAFLDTKYRDLWEESLPTSMLYQLAIYALSGSAGDTATILYPTSTAAAREAQIIVYDPIRATQRATVVLRPVNLHAIEAAISPTSHRQAEALATHVVFGAHPPPALEAHASYTGTLLGS
jgi:5-methylcytosine-specific restriction enzyme subunit McrC